MKIVLTGGGTAGHVTPNLALIPLLREQGYDIRYIGSIAGMEKNLIEDAGIPYKGISSGKLRRYFDLRNFSDPFRVIKGIGEARHALAAFRPDVVFSKGGFVSVPVVLAAHHLKIPVVLHESDMTPGLANKICIPYAVRICCNFPETGAKLPSGKAVVTGCPIRRELAEGSREAGLALAGFDGAKPLLMIMGGSLGSVRVNTAVRDVLPELTKDFDVVHLCGKGNLDESLVGTPGYVQFEYISEELKDLFAATDCMISRAGANAICELVALRKPNVLIPLSANASRGDQILNAESFRKQGFSEVLQEEELIGDALAATVRKVWANREQYIAAMEQSPLKDGAAAVVDVINEVAGTAAR